MSVINPKLAPTAVKALSTVGITPQNRFRSKVFWAAVVAQIFTIVALSGLDKTLGIDMGMAGKIIGGAMELLVLFGIFNDPTNKTGV